MNAFVLDAPDFHLQHTLESGQAFRWRRAAGGYVGVIGGGLAVVQQVGAQLHCRTSEAAALDAAGLARYFALDLDLPAILKDIDRDPQIHEAIRRYRGLRILRQAPWECLASYIISSFNNIRRIEGIIERIASRLGEPVTLEGYTGHAFPGVEAVAAAPPALLTELGLGFRAGYLREAAGLIARERRDLAALSRLPYPEAKEQLLSLPGVGEKVADCILLFSQEHAQAFPIDVWMERALRFYFRRQLPPRQRLYAFARRHFGPYAGYAQQYLFHYWRNKHRPQSVPAVSADASAALAFSSAAITALAQAEPLVINKETLASR